jgi:hypothetical protein
MSNLLMGLTFLMIGDSHMANPRYLITTLQDDLMAAGAKVVSYGVCGVSAGAWVTPHPMPCGAAMRDNKGPIVENRDKTAKTTPIDQLIAKVHPNVLVVEIGDPMAGYNLKVMPRANIADNVSELTTRIKATHLPCVWIGPGWGTEGGPYFKTFARVKELSDYLKTIVSPCQYIDSLQLSKPGEWPTFDGQHYTSVGYQKWGAALAQVIEQNVTLRAMVKH